MPRTVSGHIGEVPAVFARAKDHRRQPVQHAYHKAGDHLGQIPARVLARTVGVERPDDDRRQPVGLPVGFGIVFTGELGGAVNRSRFAYGRGFDEGLAPAIAINLR